MNRLSIVRFGFALAASTALVRLGCIFVLATVPEETSIRFFNSLVHGVDVAPILRMDMPVGEMIVGLAELFVLTWLFGAMVACLYNLTARAATAHK